MTMADKQPCPVVPRDFSDRSSYYVQLDLERRRSPECCDVLLYSNEGISFMAHKEVLCDSSDFFRFMFTSDFIEGRTNECQLQMFDEGTLTVVLDYLYRKELNISDDLLLPVFAASHFLSLRWLHAYCAASIARRPFETTLKQPLFRQYVATNSAIVDLLLDLDLMVEDATRLQNLVSEWPADENLTRVAKRLKDKSRVPRELAIIFERSIGYAVEFTGNRTQVWFEPSSFKIPLKSQHIAVTHDRVYYATDSLVGVVSRAEPIHKDRNATLVWPPLLRQYGSSAVIWTTNNRRSLCIRRAESAESRATEKCFSFESGSLVRHIASTDSREYKHVTVVVTTCGRWEVLQRREEVEGFVNLGCPLAGVECAAILLDTLYVIGSKTASSVPKTMFRYDHDRKLWVELSDRRRHLVPLAFVPLNGRLYIFTRGLPTVEVYEPSVDSWMLDEIHEFVQIGGFSVV